MEGSDMEVDGGVQNPTMECDKQNEVFSIHLWMIT
jgi:hypothetical protein